MNFIKRVKGGTEKKYNNRNLKWLGLATVATVAATSPYWLDLGGSDQSVDQSFNPSVKASAGLESFEKAATQCGCGAAHAPQDHDIKLIDSIGVVGAKDVLSAELGDELGVSFGRELSVRGKVTMNKEVVGGRVAMSMDLLGQKGYMYWLQDPEGGVIGNVVVKSDEGNQVYNFKKQSGGWLVEKLAFQEYICASGDTDDSVGMPIAEAPFEGVAADGDIPILNSLPTAEAVLYMDCDGELVTGTRWNAALGGADIDAQPAGYTEAEIRQVWEETAEDMRPFNINVTTDRAVFDAAPVNRRMQVIITPTRDAEPDAGGVAFLNSFADGSIDPCWNFNLGLGSSAPTNSHEVGHTFGLMHDGLGELEYHPGNGVWGPIMGAPFDHDVVSWSEGNYTNNTNTEDDLAIITERNGFGFRDDEHGDTNPEAVAFSSELGSEDVSETGIIETSDDVDVFTFQTNGGMTDLNIIPTSAYPNINLQATLLDAQGGLIELNDGANYGASISQNLTPGIYYLRVTGTADGNPDDAGFNDYGSLGGYAVMGTVTGLGGLLVDIVQPVPEDVSIIEGNGLVLEATVQGNPDIVRWSQASGPVGGIATFAPANQLDSRVTFTVPGMYTLKFTAAVSGLESDVTVRVSVEKSGGTKLFANRGPEITITSPEEFYSKRGLLSGRVVDDGEPAGSQLVSEWKIVSGSAEILNPSAVYPMIEFVDSNPNLVVLEGTDGEISTFREIEVRSAFSLRQVVGKGSEARWFVPLDDSLGLDWTAGDYDDSAWGLAQTGIGFNGNQDYATWLGVGGDIKSSMKRKSPSAFVRVPFDLPTSDYLEGATLKMRYNDGFVIYLNGVEIARRNVSAGALSWNSTAISSRSLSDVTVPDTFDLSSGLAAASLVAGENILAIHGLNVSKGSGQFLVDPFMEIGIIEAPYLLFTDQYGGGLLPTGDKDGDGVVNFVEHALRTDPTVPNGVNPLTPKHDGAFEINLPVDLPQDVDYIVERSSDMETWTEVATKRGKADWVTNGVSIEKGVFDAESVTYKLEPVGGGSQSFIRLVFQLRGPQS